jgi:hypothetical protein
MLFSNKYNQTRFDKIELNFSSEYQAGLGIIKHCFDKKLFNDILISIIFAFFRSGNLRALSDQVSFIDRIKIITTGSYCRNPLGHLPAQLDFKRCPLLFVSIHRLSRSFFFCPATCTLTSIDYRKCVVLNAYRI